MPRVLSKLRKPVLQPFDEFLVCRRELKLFEVRSVHPPQVRNLDWLRFTTEQRAVEKMEPDSSRWIRMRYAEVFGIDANVDAKLLANFALQRSRQGFVSFHLAAGKLPIARKVDVIETSCDKDLVRAANDCGNNGYCHERSEAAWR